MTKTTQFLQILHHIAQSPNRCLSEEKVKEIMGNPPKATWHRNINELIEGSADVPALLMETSDRGSGQVFYCINHRGWQAFIDAHTEGKFLLECYRQVGHLLDSNFANMVFDITDVDRKRVDTLSRKFLHLVKIKAQRTERSKEVLDTILKALISEHRVEISYDDGGVREFQPYTLCQHRDELYIMGYRKKGESLWEKRTYKLSRILNIRLLESKFRYPDRSDWNPMEEYQSSSGLITGEIKKVKINVYGLSRKVILEKDFFNGELLNQTSDFDSYMMSYSNIHEFLGQLFVYAQDVEIVDDEDLKEAFLVKAQSALMRNQSSERKSG